MLLFFFVLGRSMNATCLQSRFMSYLNNIVCSTEKPLSLQEYAWLCLGLIKAIYISICWFNLYIKVWLSSPLLICANIPSFVLGLCSMRSFGQLGMHVGDDTHTHSQAALVNCVECGVSFTATICNGREVIRETAQLLLLPILSQMYNWFHILLHSVPECFSRF